MITSLSTPKKYNTYTDTFLMLGLAKIVEHALIETGQNQQIQLIDQGTSYRLELTHPLNLDLIIQLDYLNPFPPIKGAKTNCEEMPPEAVYFNVAEQTEVRKLYREYRYQTGKKTEWKEDTPPPPNPRTQNGVILTSLRHDKHHNNLWLDSWQLKNHYGVLIKCLIEGFHEYTLSLTNQVNISSLVAAKFKQLTGISLPTSCSAIKIYLPSLVQGVNRVKADTNQYGSQDADWLDLWLIANGFFEFALSEKIKIAERVYDWRSLALEPKDISLEKYRDVLNYLRQYNPPSESYGIARFDAELVIKICQQLLNYHQSKAQDKPIDMFDFWHKPVTEFIRGFKGTHFNSKGQVYGVKDIFSFGLPGWISPENYQDLGDYLELLEEHLKVIIFLSSDPIEFEILGKYRDFITAVSIKQFFSFNNSYADYVVRKLADNNPIKPSVFTKKGLDLMMKKEVQFTKIIQDYSFLRIAKAINQATVYAGEIKTKEGTVKLDWERNYGLAQILSSQAGSKKDFIAAITEFLAKYENENLRLSEKLLKQGKSLRRVWTTKEDLDRLIELIEDNDHILVANLLLAYGYAKWTSKKQKPDKLSEDELEQEKPDELSEDELE